MTPLWFPGHPCIQNGTFPALYSKGPPLEGCIHCFFALILFVSELPIYFGGRLGLKRVAPRALPSFAYGLSTPNHNTPYGLLLIFLDDNQAANCVESTYKLPASLKVLGLDPGYQPNLSCLSITLDIKSEDVLYSMLYAEEEHRVVDFLPYHLNFSISESCSYKQIKLSNHEK